MRSNKAIVSTSANQKKPKRPRAKRPSKDTNTLASTLHDAASRLTRKPTVNADVFVNPEKYAVCLPISKVVADSKVDRKGVESYKSKIENGEKIAPLIVVKHPQKDLYAVLDGHHRYYALAELGRKKVDCALAGDYSSVMFYLTENGYLQPALGVTKAIRAPAKELHKNLQEFLERFAPKK